MALTQYPDWLLPGEQNGSDIKEKKKKKTHYVYSGPVIYRKYITKDLCKKSFLYKDTY